MKQTKLSRLSGQYLAALQSHFEQGPEASLVPAHDMGCRAVAIGLETLDLAKIHDQALVTLVSADGAAGLRDDMTRQAAIFFTEAIIPIEATHRIALEAGADLNQLNVALGKRTLDLADSKRELQQGIALRKAAEKALETSGAQSAELLAESRKLQKHLQGLAHQILSANEDERKTMSLMLQDEIAQTLLGIQVRLLALKGAVSASNVEFNKEIAITQQLVQKSVKTLDRIARDAGHPS